jgi:hypothetical protein
VFEPDTDSLQMLYSLLVFPLLFHGLLLLMLILLLLLLLLLQLPLLLLLLPLPLLNPRSSAAIQPPRKRPERALLATGASLLHPSTIVMTTS